MSGLDADFFPLFCIQNITVLSNIAVCHHVIGEDLKVELTADFVSLT